MILKRSSTLLAHFFVLLWVLTDLANKAGTLFDTQDTSYRDNAFGPYLGIMILTLLTPTPRNLKRIMGMKLIVVTALVIPVVLVLPLILARFSGEGSLRTQFAVDLIFVVTLPLIMWRIPKHDLELVERPEQGATASHVAS